VGANIKKPSGEYRDDKNTVLKPARRSGQMTRSFAVWPGVIVSVLMVYLILMAQFQIVSSILHHFGGHSTGLAGL